MKQSLELAAYIGTILIILFTVVFIQHWNQAFTKSVGPHTTYNWSSSYFAKLDGEFQLENSTDYGGSGYFELHQTGKNPLQSQYVEPALGDDYGSYTLTAQLEGTYSISGHAKIYSLKPANILFTPTEGEQVRNTFLGILLGLCVWILWMIIISIIS